MFVILSDVNIQNPNFAPKPGTFPVFYRLLHAEMFFVFLYEKLCSSEPLHCVSLAKQFA